MFGTTVVALVASLLAVQPIIDDTPTEKLVIDLVTVNGSGCPPGTAAIAVSEDNTAFTVNYYNYFAMVGVGAIPTDYRKFCQLSLMMHVPAGFTYAVTQTDHLGYAELAEGATATQRWTSYFAGMSPTGYRSHTFNGPFDDNWQTTDTTDIASLTWHPCGELRNLNINTELRVASGTSDRKRTRSFIGMDEFDRPATFHLAWKRC